MVSSIERLLRYGSASETEQQKRFGRRTFFDAQSLSSEISPKQWTLAEQSPPGAPEYSRVLRHRRVLADCFGANPVASALGDLARRDPGEAVRTYHEGRATAPITGTFYLAGKRNFLFGSDILLRRNYEALHLPDGRLKNELRRNYPALCEPVGFGSALTGSGRDFTKRGK